MILHILKENEAYSFTFIFACQMRNCLSIKHTTFAVLSRSADMVRFDSCI